MLIVRYELGIGNLYGCISGFVSTWNNTSTFSFISPINGNLANIPPLSEVFDFVLDKS